VLVLKGVLLLQQQPDWVVNQARVAATRNALRQAAADRQAWWQLQLAVALQGAGKAEGAVRQYQICADVSRSRELTAWVLYAAAKMALEGGDYLQALELAAKGFTHEVRPELACIMSWASLKAGRVRHAITWATL